VRELVHESVRELVHESVHELVQGLEKEWVVT
jgi:hypothetical protein